MLVSLTGAELTVSNTQMLGKSSSMPDPAFTIIRQTDTVQKSPTLLSEAEAQKNTQLLQK